MSRLSVSEQLSLLQEQHALRQRKLLQSPQGVEVQLDGDSYLSFCSNDYLGLANHPKVIDAASAAIQHYGVGSGASQYISGYHLAHKNLEDQLCEFFDVEKVVLFSSGFLANLGVLTALGDKDSLILQDKLNHASLVDGGRYAEGTLKRYKHCDVNHAHKLLKESNAQNKLLVTDGVFSMEGTVAPLADLANLSSEYNATFIVDDAHGIAVLGTTGQGSLQFSNVPINKVDVLVGTFGKAFGSSGAFIAGKKDLIELIAQKARTLIYTTAMPPAIAAATSQALEIISQEPERRQRLQHNIEYFQTRAKQLNIPITPSISPIQTILIGDNQTTLNISEHLAKQNILVIAIRPPTVPPNTARLRITLCSEHCHQHIDQLLSALSDSLATYTS